MKKYTNSFSSQLARDEVKKPTNSFSSQIKWSENFHQISFTDGSVFVGRVYETSDSIHILFKNEQELIFLNKDVLKKKELNKGERKVSTKLGKTRYLYSPSAMTLKQGQFAFSQKELFFSTLAYGIHDNVSIQLGSILPVLFISGGANGILAFKVGGEVEPYFHIGGGLQSFIFIEEAFHTPFGVLTMGNAQKHISINIGIPFSNSGSTNIKFASLSAFYNFTRNISLVSENFLIMSDESIGRYGESVAIHGLAMRYSGESFYTDIGFLMTEEIPVPYPWIDISLDF
jgi:hypothetical protein